MMYYRRRYDYDMGAMMMFFTKGIKVKHLVKWTGRYYRFALIMKLVLFEIFIVSLQMLPKTQLFLMTTAQLAIVIIIFKAFLIDRIYNHKFFGFMDLLTEFTILGYFVVGNISTWIGENNVDRSFWTNIQLVEIYMILVTAFFNVV
jgi:hypothetical protein